MILRFALVLLALTLPRVEASTLPAAPIHHTLLISIDGLRPDLLLRADTPNLHALIQRGSFSMWAWTTAVAITLPSHVSMLTGVVPSHHRIYWNNDLPLTKPIYPARPTLFELARQSGYSTAMVTGKSKFTALAKPGTLDWTFIPEKESVPDQVVADTASAWIAQHDPNLLFVHFGAVDIAGHDQGWGSPAQLAAIAGADRCVGRLLDALKSRGLLDSTLVLVTSDHGGAGKGHGPDDPRSRHIPWIVAGPGIRRNLDLTGDADLDVHTEDTFATIAYLMGIAPTQSIDGHPVLQVLEESHAASASSTHTH